MRISSQAIFEKHLNNLSLINVNSLLLTANEEEYHFHPIF